MEKIRDRSAGGWAQLGAAVLLVAALLAGCGSSGGSTEASKPSRTDLGGAAEREAPKGASPTLKAIYRQFPKPRPGRSAKAAAAAVRAGEAACRGMTPEEAKRRYFGKAAARLLPDQRKMVAKLQVLARNPRDASFVAGQLAALLYEKSLADQKLASYGYQGCVYQLARVQERKLERPGR